MTKDRDEREKNERVIHTRVPERLETELKDRAEALGVSVSNLVRNVLGNAFGLVEDILGDSAKVALSARGAVKTAPPRAGASGRNGHDGHDDVIGWQEMVMNKNAVCERCNAMLPRGADAAIAILDGSGPRTIVCPDCLEEIRHGRDRRDARDDVRNPDDGIDRA
jgi:hypothetical protein